MRRAFWKIIPYVSLIVFSIIFFCLSIRFSRFTSFENWLLSISANLFSVLLIYFLYEIIKAKSQKELNKEIFYYAKSYIDGDVLSILMNLTKLLYGVEKGIQLNRPIDLKKASKEYIQDILKEKKIMGFQLFKIWVESLKNFSKILENNFILNRLNDAHILILIKIINSLRRIENVLVRENVADALEEKLDPEDYKVIKGTKINIENTEFPSRYLLLKRLEKDKFVVKDFGDFREEDKGKLLTYYKIKPEKLDLVSSSIFNTLKLITKWYNETGKRLQIQ